MNTNLCQHRQLLMSRRAVLQTAGCGFGYMAFAALAASHSQAAEESAKQNLAKQAAKAKHVIFLCMRGGPSHVDTFDYKPLLTRDDGKAAVRPNSTWLKSPWKFKQQGQSGLWFSELVPGVAKHADKLCMIHSMQTDVPAHPQAMVRLHTGSSQFIRPSMGAWTVYGLGVENENLPGFISIAPQGAGGGAQNYGSAFLPAKYQGMRLGNDRQQIQDTRISNLKSSAGPIRQKIELDLIQKMNQEKLQATGNASEIEGVIESYETAFRMQEQLPQLIDLETEDARTKAMYGLDDQATANFGSKCLLARRLVESGVRFVEVTFGNWDQHNNLDTDLPRNCQQIDKGIDGLLTDLAARGLLDETLVVWTGEFGRTPYGQQNNGRDHNHKAFTLWMAGGGTKPGFSYGSSGDYGYEATENPVPVVDLHATLLALMGLDHEHLTYRYAGRDFRLTDTAGRVIKEVMA